MTLDALAEKLYLNSLRRFNSATEIRAALAQAERMGMERAAKMFDKKASEYTRLLTHSEIAAAIRAEMEAIK